MPPSYPNTTLAGSVHPCVEDPDGLSCMYVAQIAAFKRVAPLPDSWDAGLDARKRLSRKLKLIVLARESCRSPHALDTTYPLWGLVHTCPHARGFQNDKGTVPSDSHSSSCLDAVIGGYVSGKGDVDRVLEAEKNRLKPDARHVPSQVACLKRAVCPIQAGCRCGRSSRAHMAIICPRTRGRSASRAQGCRM